MCCVLYVRTLEGGIWLSRSLSCTHRTRRRPLFSFYLQRLLSLCFFWLRREREREVRRRLKKEADRPSSVSLFSAPSRLKDGEYSFLALNGGGRHRVLFSSASSAPHNVPGSIAQYRPEREKRPPCPVPAILPVFPYPGDNLPSRRVVFDFGKERSFRKFVIF